MSCARHRYETVTNSPQQVAERGTTTRAEGTCPVPGTATEASRTFHSECRSAERQRPASATDREVAVAVAVFRAVRDRHAGTVARHDPRRPRARRPRLPRPRAVARVLRRRVRAPRAPAAGDLFPASAASSSTTCAFRNRARAQSGCGRRLRSRRSSSTHPGSITSHSQSRRGPTSTPPTPRRSTPAPRYCTRRGCSRSTTRTTTRRSSSTPTAIRVELIDRSGA